MNVEIVVGANYGDEGKGLVSKLLTENHINHKGERVLNILYNGGCQRGHTVDIWRPSYTNTNTNLKYKANGRCCKQLLTYLDLATFILCG